MSRYKKILILGSGALKIGEAGEFDYSGSQAMKALKEERIKTVLINPNIATIQTSPLLADKIYFLPITEYFVERVIAKERPDGVLLSFGGQTALNCGIALSRKGILREYKVAVLGTPIEAIILTEDRQKFAEHLRALKIPLPPSQAAMSEKEARAIANKIGFPVMVRAAYALGGQKSGVADHAKELAQIVRGALAVFPQVLVEKYLHHYKEVEYEVVRDSADNCVTVCNMENFDPLGIHTGDSIVVAPSQTLNNAEYHVLRAEAIKIVKSLGIVGECNVQFALNPRPKNSTLEYYVIEVNARLSRSSALASKATGYPLAYVAAKLALGKRLNQIKNQVTKVTQSFFEPALDYVVVKIPRWDLEKFRGAEEKIGSAMKSVGEVMAIGRTFEEALQKAVRMLRGRGEELMDNGFDQDKKYLRKFLETPTPRRLFALASALRKEISIAELYRLTGIDPWFLSRIRNIVQAELGLVQQKNLTDFTLRRLKQLGFSDQRIGRLVDKSEAQIKELRKRFKIVPSVFQIDTLAGEVPAKTNYLYLTYNGHHHDVAPLGREGVVVLGSGPYHIGSSVEFDWSCVHAVLALKHYRKKSIIINCNPETVSTDYDISDRLYFEELNLETVSEIIDFEKAGGVVLSVGGQTPNNLARGLARAGTPILGTYPEDIDRAEDRGKFSKLLDKLRIPQPPWNTFSNIRKLKDFAAAVGYPVLVRPSYVLSGSAMNVCFDEAQLEDFVTKAVGVSREAAVTVSKFIPGAKEIELDAVAERGQIRIFAIAEHIENAGVHSGDATIVYPTQKVYVATEHRLLDIAEQLADALRITGPFNIQFLVKEHKAYVIEINLRASRTFPFISKATGVNFAESAAAAFYGKSQRIALPYPDHVVVKSPQFSFSRLQGADPVLRVEMSSTGEVACFGGTLEEALLKAIFSSTALTTKKAVLLSIGGEINKKKFLDSAKKLAQQGYKIFATSSTSRYLKSQGVKSELVYKLYEGGTPNVLDIISKKKVAFVINLSERNGEPERHFRQHVTDGYLIRRAAVDANIPLFTDLRLAQSFVKALAMYQPRDLQIKSWDEYLTKETKK